MFNLGKGTRRLTSLVAFVTENWPGFDVPPIRNDSLWDTDYNPLDPLKTWTPAAEPPSTASVFDNIFPLMLPFVAAI